MALKARTIISMGVPVVALPAQQPERRFTHIGFWDAGRIVLAAEPLPSTRMLPDDVVIGPSGTVWRVMADGRGWDVTAAYDAMIDAAELAAVDAAQRDITEQI